MTGETRIGASEEDIVGVNGLKLHVRCWRPKGPALGVVMVVPGFNSHGAYYSWVAEQLTAAALVVYALDLRGRGESDGERFYVETFDDYVSDVAVVADAAAAREAEKYIAGIRAKVHARVAVPSQSIACRLPGGRWAGKATQRIATARKPTGALT